MRKTFVIAAAFVVWMLDVHFIAPYDATLSSIVMFCCGLVIGSALMDKNKKREE